MRTLEAKNFLVQQTAEQAALENVPLSDLEKRMMYFPETGACPEDPIALNDAFEAQYDTGEYEPKISRLLHNAYQRLRQENDAARKNWDLAVKCLRRSDHYLLVMWDASPPSEWSVSENPCRQLRSYFRYVFDYSRARKTPTTMEMDTKAYSDDNALKSAHPVRNLYCDSSCRILLSTSRRKCGGLAHGPNIVPFFGAEGKQKGFRLGSRPYFSPTSFSNSPSLKIVTPNSFALSYFDPGSVPTTT